MLVFACAGEKVLFVVSRAQGCLSNTYPSRSSRAQNCNEYNSSLCLDDYAADQIVRHAPTEEFLLVLDGPEGCWPFA